MNGRKLFGLTVVAAFLYIVYPLIFPVLMGAILAVLFIPLVERMEEKKVSTGLASLLVTLGVTILILLPTAIIFYQGAKTGVQQLQTWKDAPKASSGDWIDTLVHTENFHSALQWFTTWFPVGIDELTSTIQDLMRGIGLRAADLLGNLLTRLPSMALALAIIVVSIYFFLIDGRKLVFFVRRHSFFTPSQTDLLIHSAATVCRSVVLAAVVSGLCQATFETIVLFATQVPEAIFFGVIVFISSFIPVIGTAPITFGIAVHQLLQGRTSAGIVLLCSAVIVTTMDNLIRPWFLRGAANLHPLLAFVAAFGGLQTLGFTGIFLGPVIAALLLSTIQVFTSPGEAVNPNPDAPTHL